MSTNDSPQPLTADTVTDDLAERIRRDPPETAPSGWVYEYRCTRPDVYPVNSPGAKDVSARQGYYITARTRAQALSEMRIAFPNDLSFDVPAKPTKVMQLGVDCPAGILDSSTAETNSDEEGDVECTVCGRRMWSADSIIEDAPVCKRHKRNRKSKEG